MGDHLVPGYSSAVKSLEGFDVAGLEASYFAVNSFYGSGLVIARMADPLPYNP
jgi:hypothetical protein